MAFLIVVVRPFSSRNESAGGSTACGGGEAEMVASCAEVKLADAGMDRATAAAAIAIIAAMWRTDFMAASPASRYRNWRAHWAWSHFARRRWASSARLAAAIAAQERHHPFAPGVPWRGRSELERACADRWPSARCLSVGFARLRADAIPQYPLHG